MDAATNRRLSDTRRAEKGIAVYRVLEPFRKV